MNKKKMVKVVLLVLIICVVLFLGLTIRKMVILNDLSQKAAQYVDNDNHYEKIVNDSASTKTVTEYYCKGDNAVLFLNTTIKATGETRKLTKYSSSDKANLYFETGENKTAVLNTDGAVPGQVQIINMNFDDNLWYLFQVAVTSSIKSGEWNGKECYVINGNIFICQDSYYEKETGLIVKGIDGTETDENGNKSDRVIEYYYEFDNVDDSVFVEPDISEYEIEEN